LPFQINPDRTPNTVGDRAEKHPEPGIAGGKIALGASVASAGGEPLISDAEADEREADAQPQRGGRRNLHAGMLRKSRELAVPQAIPAKENARGFRTLGVETIAANYAMEEDSVPKQVTCRLHPSA